MTSSLKSGWVVKPLIEVATLQRGYDLPVQNRSLGKVQIFAANGPVGNHNEAKVSGPGVITGRSGSIGKVHYVESDYWPLNTALYVKDFHGNDPKFIYYLLSTFGLEKYSEGTGVPTLNRNNVHGVNVSLPPLPEQKRIAAILEKADSIRRKRQQAVKLTEELLRSVFLDMFGDPVTNPKGWEVKSLAELVDFTTGKLDSNAAVNGGEYPFFTCSREDLQINTYAFDCEALLLAGNNASADYSVKHYNGKFNAYQRTYVITMKQPTLSYRYMQYALEMKLSDMKRLSKGTNTKYLTLGILNDMQFHVPDAKTQFSFEKIITRLSNTATKFRDAIVISDTLFTSLLQRAFMGSL